MALHCCHLLLCYYHWVSFVYEIVLPFATENFVYLVGFGYAAVYCIASFVNFFMELLRFYSQLFYQLWVMLVYEIMLPFAIEIFVYLVGFGYAAVYFLNFFIELLRFYLQLFYQLWVSLFYEIVLPLSNKISVHLVRFGYTTVYCITSFLNFFMELLCFYFQIFYQLWVLFAYEIMLPLSNKVFLHLVGIGYTAVYCITSFVNFFMELLRFYLQLFYQLWVMFVYEIMLPLLNNIFGHFVAFGRATVDCITSFVNFVKLLSFHLQLFYQIWMMFVYENMFPFSIKIVDHFVAFGGVSVGCIVSFVIFFMGLLCFYLDLSYQLWVSFVYGIVLPLAIEIFNCFVTLGYATVHVASFLNTFVELLGFHLQLFYQVWVMFVYENVLPLSKKIFDHFVAFGDSIVDYIASFVNFFDDFQFKDDDVYIAWLTDPLTEFKRETLNAHNNYRTVHGCPPLVLSEELSSTAQGWADKLADRGYPQYSENPGLGENICVLDFDTSSSRRAGEQLVREWYREIDHYNYNNPGWKREAYRVSQLLWKSTSEIGVGFSRIPGQNKAIVVVNYRPAGNNNMPGEFERNVLPPQKTDNANLRRTART